MPQSKKEYLIIDKQSILKLKHDAIMARNLNKKVPAEYYKNAGIILFCDFIINTSETTTTKPQSK